MFAADCGHQENILEPVQPHIGEGREHPLTELPAHYRGCQDLQENPASEPSRLRTEILLWRSAGTERLRLLDLLDRAGETVQKSLTWGEALS